MEDFSSLIWVVIFGAAMLFSAVTKKSRKQQSGESNPHEAWPPLLGKPEEETPASERAETAPFSAPECENERFTELSAQLSARNAVTDRKPRKQLQSVAGTTPEHANSEDLQSAETAGNAIAEEFDLRKAVIYAEILKPKFDE